MGNPRWASPSIPFWCAHCPVNSDAWLGEQAGAALNARRNSTPSDASFCRFGVGTA